MHPVFLAVILFSLIFTSLACHRTVKTKANKWTRISIVFLVNAFLLSLAAVLLYKLDFQTFHKQSEGIMDSMGIVTLLFFIPINTFINIQIMEFFKNRVQQINLKE